ncbi:hypothetical protein LCGC14_3074570 [marine sediment metagenome]|uniref:PDZ domain-containing protein n=1 Tax=marine sediment metagenome TaxID=412755 RepID=A0A0F8Z5T3_9ZZZZ
MVDRIIPGSPGAIAGLKTSDAIVALDGKPFERMATLELVASSFVGQIRRMSPGQNITLTVIRAGQSVELKMTLAELPQGPDDADRYVNEKLGFAVRDKVALDQHMITSPTGSIPGLLVLGVYPRTPAASAGLKAEDVITSVNGRQIKTVAVFRKIVSDALSEEPNKVITVRIHRDGEKPQVISIRPPSTVPSDSFDLPFGGLK